MNLCSICLINNIFVNLRKSVQCFSFLWIIKTKYSCTLLPKTKSLQSVWPKKNPMPAGDRLGVINDSLSLVLSFTIIELLKKFGLVLCIIKCTQKNTSKTCQGNDVFDLQKLTVNYLTNLIYDQQCRTTFPFSIQIYVICAAFENLPDHFFNLLLLKVLMYSKYLSLICILILVSFYIYYVFIFFKMTCFQN